MGFQNKFDEKTSGPDRCDPARRVTASESDAVEHCGRDSKRRVAESLAQRALSKRAMANAILARI
jgi:hypothetical protein